MIDILRSKKRFCLWTIKVGQKNYNWPKPVLPQYGIKAVDIFSLKYSQTVKT